MIDWLLIWLYISRLYATHTRVGWFPTNYAGGFLVGFLKAMKNDRRIIASVVMKVSLPSSATLMGKVEHIALKLFVLKKTNCSPKSRKQTFVTQHDISSGLERKNDNCGTCWKRSKSYEKLPWFDWLTRTSPTKSGNVKSKMWSPNCLQRACNSKSKDIQPVQPL